MSYKSFSFGLLGIAAGAFMTGALQFVVAWAPPGQPAPGGNVGAPINVSRTSQLKSGPLGINTTQALLPGSGLEVRGNVLVGRLTSADQIKVGNTTLECNVSNGGALRYNATAKCVEFCDESAWKCTNQSAVLPPPPPSNAQYNVACSGGRSPVGYCDAGDRRISCIDTGHGRNHWVVELFPNGCQAFEGGGNYGSEGCSVLCTDSVLPSR